MSPDSCHKLTFRRFSQFINRVQVALSLTYDMLVKGHGGSIAPESVEGQGPEFIIKLPILK